MYGCDGLLCNGAPGLRPGRVGDIPVVLELTMTISSCVEYCWSLL